MTTRTIFFASLLIGTLAIHAATAQAQSNVRSLTLPQKKELKVAASTLEDTCRISVSALLEIEWPADVRGIRILARGRAIYRPLTNQRRISVRLESWLPALDRLHLLAGSRCLKGR